MEVRVNFEYAREYVAPLNVCTWATTYVLIWAEWIVSECCLTEFTCIGVFRSLEYGFGVREPFLVMKFSSDSLINAVFVHQLKVIFPFEFISIILINNNNNFLIF